jgi:hypothetical protein
MTLANDDSRIFLDGDTAPVEPSAPPLTELIGTDHSIPTVFATAIPPPFAPRHEGWTTTPAAAADDDDVLATTVPPPFAPHLAGVAAATTTAGGGRGVGRRVVRTNEPDGSLSVDVYTTTRRPDGGREVRIENFRIHAGDAAGQAAAHAFRDDDCDGQSPGDAYLTRVEVRTYPPGTADDDARGTASAGGRLPPPARATPGYSATTEAVVMHAQTNPNYERPRVGRWCICCGVCWGMICLVFILLVILGAVYVPARIFANSNPFPPTPTVFLWPTPTPATDVSKWTLPPTYQP